MWPHYLSRSNQWKESFLYKLFMKFVWDCLSCFKMTLASFWNRMKQFQTNLALIMTIHFAHDCVEMVRCSSVFRMSSIFAETSVSRTKKNLEGKLKSHVHTHLAVTTCSVVRDSTRFLCSAALSSPSTKISLTIWQCNSLYPIFHLIIFLTST